MVLARNRLQVRLSNDDQGDTSQQTRIKRSGCAFKNPLDVLVGLSFDRNFESKVRLHSGKLGPVFTSRNNFR